MGKISYIPTAMTLGPDFAAAVTYLKQIDPVTLGMLPNSRKDEFVQDTLERFFDKIEPTNRQYDLVMDCLRANIRQLIGVGGKSDEPEYHDKIRNEWSQSVPNYIYTILPLATTPPTGPEELKFERYL